MIDATSKTTTTISTRRRVARKLHLNEETINGKLPNGSYRLRVQDDSTDVHNDVFDRSWNVMKHGDYLDYRKRRSGNLDSSRVSKSGVQEEGTKSPGYVFRFYKKFGDYWNVFPKTDYCYLPGSPDYQREVSPGIPMVPNLSRKPLPSYLRQQAMKGTSSTDGSILDASLGPPMMSSTISSYDKHYELTRTLNEATERESVPNHRYNRYVREERHTLWRRVRSLTKTILTVMRIRAVTAITGLLSSNNHDGSRSRFPLLFFLLLLFPLMFLLFFGAEKVMAVSSPASGFLSWWANSLTSTLNLVKDFYIPALYFQLAAIFRINSSNVVKSESPCQDLPAQIDTPPPFPVLNLSDRLAEEKLLALQTEIAGLTAWIERIQDQLTNLNEQTEEKKKVTNQLENQRTQFYKLEGEFADRMIERAVAKYHADRTGKPDYALQSSGGYIVRVRCAQTYTKNAANMYVLGLRMPWDIYNGPDMILKPGVMPGECWAFEGSFAQVTIHLATKVKVTGFSLEHSPKELALHGHISSAPKEFSVWAMENEYDVNPHLLGKYTFLDNGESLQHFDAIPYDQGVELIELKVESNHGNPEYTCVYRVRVHGVPSTLFEAEGNDTGAVNTFGSRVWILLQRLI